MIGGSLTLRSVSGVLISTFESHIWIRNVEVREAPEILLLNGHKPEERKRFPSPALYYSENAFLFFNALNCKASTWSKLYCKKYFSFS